jgi:hypothetical protein
MHVLSTVDWDQRWEENSKGKGGKAITFSCPRWHENMRWIGIGNLTYPSLAYSQSSAWENQSVSQSSELFHSIPVTTEAESSYTCINCKSFQLTCGKTRLSRGEGSTAAYASDANSSLVGLFTPLVPVETTSQDQNLLYLLWFTAWSVQFRVIVPRFPFRFFHLPWLASHHTHS